MPEKEIGKKNMTGDVYNSKDRNKVDKEYNTRFLYKPSGNENTSQMGAEEHTKKMMEVGSFDDAINISTSSIINHFEQKLLKSKSDIGKTKKEEKKVARKYSSFDEAKYSGSHLAFFDAKKVYEKPKRELLKRKIQDERGGIEKEENKKVARKYSPFDEAKYSGSHPAFFDYKKAIEKPD